MENSVAAKDGDVAAEVVASAENPVTATGPTKSDETDSASVTAEEAKTPTVDGKSEAVDRDDVITTKVAVDDKNCGSNATSVEVSDLSEAMASTSISTSRQDDIEQSQAEDKEQQQKQVTIPEKENVITDNTNVDSDVSVKTPLEADEEATSTAGGFEDAREYIDDEEDCNERDQSNVTHQEHISATESCGEEELLEDDEAAREEGGEVSNKFNTFFVLFS